VSASSQENGDLEKATPEKLRLEEKQRLARKTRKEQGREWENAWFGQVYSSYLLHSSLSACSLNRMSI
jgi:hypothetical protein